MKHVKQKFLNMNEQNKNAFVGNDNMIDNITKCVKAAPIHFFIFSSIQLGLDLISTIELFDKNLMIISNYKK